MNHWNFQKLICISLLAVAMAFLETSVVVYLREIYYPEGFRFPLKLISGRIAITEIIREFATLLMLTGIGILAGRNKTEKFAWFIYSFAIWDIFYYIFLKAILNWPPSIFTWDILFLIPVTWVGPVIAPVINSVTMILLSLLIFYYSEIINTIRLKPISWVLLIAGSVIVIISYTYDYSTFILNRIPFAKFFNSENKDRIIHYMSLFVPSVFNWLIFSAGVICHLLAILIIFIDLKKIKNAG
jgi:hypothetical protein